MSGESFTGPALEKMSKARSSPWSQGMQLKAQTMLLIKIGSNYIHPLPLELLTDRCAAVTAEWPLTEMFSFLAFVTLPTCLWQDQGKGFFRVPILTASPQLYIPQNSWTSNTYCLFAQITMCPYQISPVNHLCRGFVEQLPITGLAITNPSGLLIPLSEPQPVLFWRWWDVFSIAWVKESLWMRATQFPNCWQPWKGNRASSWCEGFVLLMCKPLANGVYQSQELQDYLGRETENWPDFTKGSDLQRTHAGICCWVLTGIQAELGDSINWSYLELD